MISAKARRLGDFISLVGGGTPSKDKEEYWGTEIPWATVKDLKNSRLLSTQDHITRLGLDNSASRIVKSGSIIIATRMAVGRVVITGIDTAINQDLKGIICSEKIDTKYLYYFLTSQGGYFNRVSSGATVKGIKIAHISDIEIPLPPLPEQQKIAAILDAADQLRQKDQQLIEHYTRLGQSLFLEMFGDPVKNPKGWESLELESMLSFLTSGSRGWAKYYSDDGDLFLRIQNVGKNQLTLEDVAYVVAPNNAEAKRTAVEAGDILLSITADLGRTAVIPKDIGKAYINQHLAILRLKKEYNPYYVSEYIASVGGKSQFNMMDKGGVKAGLNFKDIKSLKILTPPIEMQREYLERTQHIESQKQTTQVSLEKSEALFNSLLQRAFKGELTG